MHTFNPTDTDTHAHTHAHAHTQTQTHTQTHTQTGTRAPLTPQSDRGHVQRTSTPSKATPEILTSQRIRIPTAYILCRRHF